MGGFDIKRWVGGIADGRVNNVWVYLVTSPKTTLGRTMVLRVIVSDATMPFTLPLP